MARGITGVEQVKKALRKVVHDTRRANRKALSRVGTKGVSMLKARVPRRTGMSKRAMSKRIGTSRRTGATYLIVGPRRKFFATIDATSGKATATISNKGKVKAIKLRGMGGMKGTQEVRPTKYAHLIERRNRRSSGYGMVKAVTRQLAPMAKAEMAAETAKVLPK